MNGSWRNCASCGFEKCIDPGETACNSCRLDHQKGNHRMGMTPAETRAYLNAHKPPEIRSGSSATRAKQPDPFPNTKPGDYLHPIAAEDGQLVPRHRWGNTPSELAGLHASSADIERYERFRRDQKLALDMAMESADKAHEHAEQNRRLVSDKAPERADHGRRAPSLVPPQNPQEEDQRAEACRARLNSMGYELTRVRAEDMRLAGPAGLALDPIATFAYVVTQNGPYGVGREQYVGHLVGAEQFAWTEARERDEQTTEERQLTAKAAKPFITTRPQFYDEDRQQWVDAEQQPDPIDAHIKAEVARQVAEALARLGVAA